MPLSKQSRMCSNSERRPGCWNRSSCKGTAVLQGAPRSEAVLSWLPWAPHAVPTDHPQLPPPDECKAGSAGCVVGRAQATVVPHKAQTQETGALGTSGWFVQNPIAARVREQIWYRLSPFFLLHP